MIYFTIKINKIKYFFWSFICLLTFFPLGAIIGVQKSVCYNWKYYIYIVFYFYFFLLCCYCGIVFNVYPIGSLQSSWMEKIVGFNLDKASVNQPILCLVVTSPSSFFQKQLLFIYLFIYLQLLSFLFFYYYYFTKCPLQA